MYLKLIVLVTLLACSDGLYSSFWAPLFNPRILNYRVDATFDPDAGRNNRETYVKNFGVKGQMLIDDLGNGKGPSDTPFNDKRTNDVRFYYTYPDAKQEKV